MKIGVIECPTTDDLSAEYFDVLRDEAASETQKDEAFDKLLALKMGWWGSGSLVRFASNCARRFATRRALACRLSADQFWWEEAAQDALMTLRRSAVTVKKPKAWLVGTIRMKILETQRRVWRDISAMAWSAQLPDLVAANGGDDQHGQPDARARCELLLAALARLPPALARSARDLYLNQDQAPVDGGRAISAETKRKHRSRIRRRVRRMLRVPLFGERRRRSDRRRAPTVPALWRGKERRRRDRRAS